MKDRVIVFSLDNGTSIVFELEKTIALIDCCYDVPAYLYLGNEKILLTTDSLHENMYILKNQLTKVLNGHARLHKSITQDIGYLYNQDLQGKPGLVYKKLENWDYWVGNSYMLWNHEMATWLYNDKNGDIILEITPIYPGNFVDTDDEQNAIAYNKWIESYKPYFTTIISRNVADQWLTLSQQIFMIIESNVAT